MDARVLHSLKKELILQAWAGQGAWRGLCRRVRFNRVPGIKKSAPPLENLDPIVEWITASWADSLTMLSAAGSISRLLWPFEDTQPTNRKDREKATRAGELVSALDLPPLPELHSRKARNAFEHVEDVAPEWYEWASQAFPGQAISEWAIGDGGADFLKLIDPRRCFRFLNTSTWVLRVGREECNLKELAVAFALVAGNIRIPHTFSVGSPEP